MSIVKWTGEQSEKETSVCVISIVLAPWKSKFELNQIECNSTTSGNDDSVQCQNDIESIESVKVEPVDSESIDPQNSQSVSVVMESIKIEPQDLQSATNHDVTIEPNVGGLPQDSPNTHKESTEDEVMKQIKNTCPFCDKKFTDAYKVEQHVMYSHRKSYPCNICRRSFCAPKLLEEHQQRTHGPDFFLECNICHIKYKSEDGLKRHNIRIHTNVESKFICEHCGRSYKLKADLLTHMKRIHMSQLQICRFCGKAVKDVKSHEWRHQERNGEFKYAYSCHLCRKKFLHRSRLDNHLLLHKKGFKCEKCGKEYVGSRELKSHQRFKHGQTIISTCILCHKKFTSISNFHQHVLTHAGIRPYKCDICDEDFTQRSSLLRHRKNHPGPLPPCTAPHPQIADLARCYLQKVKDDPDSVLKHARF